MELHSPWALLLLLLLPALVIVHRRRRRSAGLVFSSVGMLEAAPVSWRVRLRPLMFWLRLVALTLLIVALARPRKGTEILSVSTDAVAMQMVVDRSYSMSQPMEYRGQRLNRLEAVKRVAREFIEGNDDDLEGRTNDLLGLITFARYADTRCPLIQGHDVLVEFLEQTDLVQPNSSEDGTAIGAALQLAAARLQKAEVQVLENNARIRREAALAGEDVEQEPDFTIKSKVVVLLTDGNENVGQVDPLDAARLAKEWGIRVYTIGIGQPVRQGLFVRDDLNERLLQAIAEATGGFYARATDAESLRAIYKKIDELEKTEVKSVQFTNYAEQYEAWALAALLVLTGAILGDCTVFRKIP